MAAAVRVLRPDRRWQASQLSRGVARGRVVAFGGDKAKFLATEFTGTVEIRGVASNDSVIVGLGLERLRRTRQWFEAGNRGMALLMAPGDKYDGVIFEQASYLAMDISFTALLEQAELAGVSLTPHTLRSSRVLPGAVNQDWLRWVSTAIDLLQEGRAPMLMPGVRIDEVILAGLIAHLGRGATAGSGAHSSRHAVIVNRARDYIHVHLAQPIHVDDLCRATGASRSALFRAFDECLGESPVSYVLKLRLNRIRADLAAPDEAQRTVTVVSHRWGIAELGRLAARYREQFGELPSETLRRRSRPPGDRH